MGEPRSGRAALAGRWSALHHGIDPQGSRLLRSWLAVMWALARPLARIGVPPTVITVLGAVLAVDAVLLPRWAAALAVFGAALCDSLDGAVAVVANRPTRFGAVADSVADRIADVCFALVLWRCGAPLWSALVAAALALGVDGLRRMRRVPALVTVGERPSWTVCALLACVTGAVHWAVLTCSAVWIVLGVVAVSQVARAPSSAARRAGARSRTRP